MIGRNMDPVTIGFSIIGILQVANLAWTGAMNAKLDSMVTDKQCIERKDACAKRQETAINIVDKHVETVDKQVSHHVHNGDGKVKYEAY